MQGIGKRPRKKRASPPTYVPPNQLTIEGFEAPIEQGLDKENRWVKLAHAIPWDQIVNLYLQCFPSKEGRQPISGRVILGAIIIKHIKNLSDRETQDQKLLGRFERTNIFPTS